MNLFIDTNVLLSFYHVSSDDLEELEKLVVLLEQRRCSSMFLIRCRRTGRFTPEAAGKMDFYLNVLNERVRAPDDNPSIGMILCTSKNDVIVEFSLRSKGNPIGVAPYTVTQKLPKDLEGKLPTAEELRAVLRESGDVQDPADHNERERTDGDA